MSTTPSYTQSDVEAVAKAIFQTYARIEGYRMSWEDLAEDSKDNWRYVAKAGLDAEHATETEIRLLHTRGTMNPTARMSVLTVLPGRSGSSAPSRSEILELFHTYSEGCRAAFTAPNLMEFAAWILGSKINDPEVRAWWGSASPAYAENTPDVIERR